MRDRQRSRLVIVGTSLLRWMDGAHRLKNDISCEGSGSIQPFHPHNSGSEDYVHQEISSHEKLGNCLSSNGLYLYEKPIIL